MRKLLTPEEVDQNLRYRRGKALRLARLGKLPCILLPDGQVRFDASELDELLRKAARPAAQAEGARYAIA